MTAWGVWLITAIVMFACVEGFALTTHRIPTLSRATIRFCARYPLIAFVLGLVIGGIAVHIFGWTPDRWC